MTKLSSPATKTKTPTAYHYTNSSLSKADLQVTPFGNQYENKQSWKHQPILEEYKMKVEITKTEIVITLPISPRPSKSGKTTVIASTAGNQATTAAYEGQPVIVGCNCYIKK